MTTTTPRIQEDNTVGDDEDLWLGANHPLMQRPIEALREQLTRNDESLSLSVAEKRAAVDKEKKHREDTGVELYGLQQQLAALQLSLEKTQDCIQDVRSQRVTADEELAQAQELYNETKKEEYAKTDAWEASHSELERLNVTLRQIEQFNEELESDIQATRQQAYGTEERMQEVEKVKRQQDMSIDSLTERLQRKTEELELYQNQLASQKGATDAAQAMLLEAENEMEAISREKKEYLSLWKAALLGMSERNSALATAEATLNALKEEAMNTLNETGGVAKAAEAERHKKEQLQSVLNRVETETRFLENQIVGVHEARSKLNEQYQMLTDSLKSVDERAYQSKAVQKRLRAQIETLQKRYERLAHEKTIIEGKILENLSDQTTLEKGAQNVFKSAQALRRRIHDVETEIGGIENELARIKVDSLNTVEHNKELEATKHEFIEELKEKDRLIENYELEIRQRNDAIEKKQIYIVRLNRKFDALTAYKEEATTGPLEATVKHMTKEIEAKSRESTTLQQEWIRKQTELVELISENEAQQAKLTELRARRTITERKQARVNEQCKHVQRQVKSIHSTIRTMHNDMTRLNQLIASHRSRRDQLVSDNFNMETDFLEKLKEMEVDAQHMERRIIAIKTEKDELFERVIDVERKVMLWEKKVQLELETQAAVDPEYGQSEIRSMKKEIHRMELRLGQLQREQENMVTEMERTIAQTDAIKLSHATTKSQEHNTKATLKKRIRDLKTNMKRCGNETKDVAHSITVQEDENQRLLVELENLQTQYGTLEDKKLQLQQSKEAGAFQCQLLQYQSRLIQEEARRYRKAADGQYRVSENVKSQHVAKRLEREKEKTQMIKRALDSLRVTHPQYETALQSMAAFI